MSELQFELVSPEKLIISKPVVMVTVPGGEGDYGVLAGHAPMVTTVRAGVITMYDDNDTSVTERIFVAGGFAEVNAERCTVLADEAILVEDLDRASLELHIKLLSESVATADDANRPAYERELAITQAKLLAVAA